jgi:hypothetical protein
MLRYVIRRTANAKAFTGDGNMQFANDPAPRIAIPGQT